MHQEHAGKELQEGLHYYLDESRLFFGVEQSKEDFFGQNIVFLDVDGVLNCHSTKDDVAGFIKRAVKPLALATGI